MHKKNFRNEWPELSQIGVEFRHPEGLIWSAGDFSESANVFRASLAGRDDSTVNQLGIVYRDEAVPSSLRASFPGDFLVVLQRPDPLDLIFISESVLTSLPSETPELSLVEALITGLADADESTVSVSFCEPAEPVVASRFPSAGPGVSDVRSSVFQTCIRKMLQRVSFSDVERKCVEAGLLLLWDFPDLSHNVSQTLEGVGAPRTGDYWHGIMHRREPDPGNAAWWFRQVGRHPAFESLSTELMEWLEELRMPLSVRDVVMSDLMPRGRFEPSLMIRMSQESLSHPGTAIETAFRAVQYLEILNLLRFSFETAETL